MPSNERGENGSFIHASKGHDESITIFGSLSHSSFSELPTKATLVVLDCHGREISRSFIFTCAHGSPQKFMERLPAATELAWPLQIRLFESKFEEDQLYSILSCADTFSTVIDLPESVRWCAGYQLPHVQLQQVGMADISKLLRCVQQGMKNLDSLVR